MGEVHTCVQHSNRYASPTRDRVGLWQANHARRPLSLIVIVFIALRPGDSLDSLRCASDEVRFGIYHARIRRQLRGALWWRGPIQDAHAIDRAAAKLIERGRIKIIVGGECLYI